MLEEYNVLNNKMLLYTISGNPIMFCYVFRQSFIWVQRWKDNVLSFVFWPFWEQFLSQVVIIFPCQCLELLFGAVSVIAGRTKGQIENTSRRRFQVSILWQ